MVFRTRIHSRFLIPVWISPSLSWNPVHDRAGNLARKNYMPSSLYQKDIAVSFLCCFVLFEALSCHPALAGLELAVWTRFA